MTTRSPSSCPPRLQKHSTLDVDSGEYESHDDVVRNGLRLLTEEDEVARSPEVEGWLREAAVPIAGATAADPSRSIPAHEVRAHFAAKLDKRG